MGVGEYSEQSSPIGHIFSKIIRVMIIRTVEGVVDIAL